MKNWIVYRHTSPSGKVYIGITSNLKNRWRLNGRNYCTYNSIFKNAIEKYGWENIQHEVILDGVLKSEAVYTEKYLIRWYKTHNMSYNITDGGEGVCGRKSSQETIEKIRNARKGKPLSEEHKMKISVAHSLEKNIAACAKGLEKAHQAWRGKHHSEKTKELMSLHSNGKGLEEARKASRIWYERKSTPIIVTKDGAFIGEFILKADVAKALNSSDSNINRALKRGIKVKGYTLNYKEGGSLCN